MRFSKRFLITLAISAIVIATTITIGIEIKKSSQIDENTLIQANATTYDHSLDKDTIAAMIRTARLYYTFWDTGQDKYLNAAIAPTYVDHTLPKDRPQGPEGVKLAMSTLRKAFPDLHCTIDDLLITGDKITARLTFTGTSEGTFMNYPRTGKPVTFTAIDILQIKNGRIVDEWHVEDTQALSEQLDSGLPHLAHA